MQALQLRIAGTSRLFACTYILRLTINIDPYNSEMACLLGTWFQLNVETLHAPCHQPNLVQIAYANVNQTQFFTINAHISKVN